MAARQPALSQKDRFLKAALRLFAKNGYAATSTREICNEVGLAHSAIYNYFPSKEAILIAIEEREMISMQAGLDAVVAANPNANSRERLEIALLFSANVAVRNQDAWRLMADMLRSLKPKNRGDVIARRDTYEQSIRRLVEDYAQSCGSPFDNATLTTRYFFGICEGISGWYDPAGELPGEALAADVAEFFMTALDAELRKN
jgi:TetR/AcrR family transcriptional regulator, cholesterol catabolism regulator